MRVLLFGATGFIGKSAALAFVRAGHDVIGTTRSEESAKELQKLEILAVVVDPAKAENWLPLLKHVDVVIDCLGGDNLRDQGLMIVENVIAESKKLRPHGPPLSYIYTSGTWVHGDDRKTVKTDRTPIGLGSPPMALTAWRTEIERKAFAAESISFTSNVIRPSIVYGTSGSLTALWFGSAAAGEIKIVGEQGQRIPTIHQDDLAEAFVLVAEKAFSVKGLVFDISNPYPESVDFMVARLKDVSGAKKITYKAPENDFEKAVASSDILRPTLASSLLGWRAKKAPLAEGMEVYYAAWKASQ